MNKVLSRKMFRRMYLKQQTPQGFQKGGIADPSLTISDEEVEKELGLENTKAKEEPTATTPEPESMNDALSNLFSLDDTSGGLTRNEKMITLLAPVAAALLTGEQKAGEGKGPGTLRALGLGLAQLPSSIMAIKKTDLESRKLAAEEKQADAEAKAAGFTGIVLLNPQQKKSVGLMEDLPASGKINAAGQVTEIVEKPSNVEEKGYRSLNTSVAQIKRIKEIIKSGEVGTGTFENIGRIIGESTGFGSKQTTLKAELETLKKNYVFALRGAQVGPKEEAGFDPIIPSASEDESVVLKKLDVMLVSLEEARAQYRNMGRPDISSIDALKDTNIATYEIDFGEDRLDKVN